MRLAGFTTDEWLSSNHFFLFVRLWAWNIIVILSKIRLQSFCFSPNNKVYSKQTSALKAFGDFEIIPDRDLRHCEGGKKTHTLPSWVVMIKRLTWHLDTLINLAKDK